MRRASTAREHLKSLPVFWIHLERATERAEQWRTRTAGLFRKAIKVTAVDGLTDITDDEARAHLVGTRRAFLDNDEIKSFKYQLPTSRSSLKTAKVNAAVRLSHRLALIEAINSGEPRFLIAEDDLVPRSSLFGRDADAVPLPPTTSQFSIWSGGLPRFNIARDDDLYRAGHSHEWQHVAGRNAFSCFGAELYELDRETAAYVLGVTASYDVAWDHAWSFAIRNLETWRLRPRAFAQVGQSYRNSRVRDQVVNREDGAA